MALRIGFDRTRFPDQSVFAALGIDFRQDEVCVSEPPETDVKIFSAMQASQEVMDKVNEYFAFGVKPVWIVSPPLQRVIFWLPTVVRRALRKAWQQIR